MKLYIESNGVKYWGYSLYWDGDRSQSPEKQMICDVEVKNLITSLDGLVDKTISPPKGSNIYVAPPCPVPTAKIRNSYNIKRGVDNADYNVFSPLETARCWTTWSNTLVINPATNEASIFYGGNDPAIIIRRMWGFQTDQVVIVKISELYSVTEASDALCSLLDGTLKKPCISYKQLDLSTDNVLTAEILYPAYKLGIDYIGSHRTTEEMANKFCLQVEALGQFNVEKYPMTMTMFRDIVKLCRGTGTYVLGTLSRRGKNVRSVFSAASYKDGDTVSEEDLTLGQDFISLLLKLNGTKFTNISTLITKLQENKIPLVWFDKFFNNIAKISRKSIYE